MRKYALVVLIALISACNVFAQDGDPIQKTLDAALAKYDSTVDDAAKQMLKLLDTARDSAQRRGDLDALQSLDSEIDAFKNDSALPKSVSTTTYQRSTQRAVARVQIAYENAIREYTKNNNIPLAKQLQTELDEIRKSGTVAVDPLKQHRIWVGTEKPVVFTITRRVGASFQARFRVNEKIVRLVSGTADTKILQWKAADVIAEKGGPGGNNTGTIIKDENGYRIEFKWQDANGSGKGGEFVLRPEKQ